LSRAAWRDILAAASVASKTAADRCPSLAVSNHGGFAMFRLSLAALLIALTTSLAAADDDAANEEHAVGSSDSKIGVVDMNYLFKNHAALKHQREDLTAEADLLQAKFESEAKAIEKKGKELKAMTVGSDEYNALESRLITEKAAIQTAIQLKRKEFIQRESRLLFDAYQQIRIDIAKLAKSRHLSIVMNVNRDEMHPENPDEVARGISRNVVWFEDSIDLTPLLEKKYARRSR
jgi:Skp family chaperone for outer membrane proteins